MREKLNPRSCKPLEETESKGKNQANYREDRVVDPQLVFYRTPRHYDATRRSRT
jgi:hypothetical protein